MSELFYNLQGFKIYVNLSIGAILILTKFIRNGKREKHENSTNAEIKILCKNFSFRLSVNVDSKLEKFSKFCLYL